MLGKSHALSGLAVWSVATPALPLLGVEVNWPTYLLGAILTAGAATAPDLDHPGHSAASNALRPVTSHLATFTERISGGHRMGTHSLLGLGLGAVAITFAATTPLALVVAFFLFAFFLNALKYPWGLRGNTKTLVNAATSAALTGAVYFTAGGSYHYIAVATIAGVILHLLGDAITKGGVPWLYPIKTWAYSLTPMRTGSPVETRLLVPVFIAMTVIGVGSTAYSSLHTGDMTASPFVTSTTTPTATDTTNTEPTTAKAKTKADKKKKAAPKAASS